VAISEHPFTGDGLVVSIGRLIRRSRLFAGWSQRALAVKAGTSQATVWRIETGQPEPVDLAVVERLLDALGLRVSLQIDDRAYGDRERQRDGVHAALNGAVARWLRRQGWTPATEVQVGVPAPRGWIDVLAWRAADRSLLVEETKADLPDLGALQRRLALYVRESREVAGHLGWRPVRVAALVVGLDSESLGDRLRTNRDLLAEAFPEPIDQMAAWIRDPAARPPRSWCIALADPRSRGEPWLRAIPGGTRRRSAAYRDYRDAAERLVRPRRSRG
jgi:transcriptional regulator with XRE-family HTH domain